MFGDASNAFHDFTNLDSYAESPSLSMRTPSRSRQASHVGQQYQQQQQSPSLQQPTSAETSSQDSASDSSSRRKRKVTSESPLSDAVTEQPVKQEDLTMDMGDGHKVQAFDQTFTRPMNDLSLEQDEAMGAHFDFNSAASSPNHPRDYKPHMALNARMPSSSMAAQYQHSLVGV